MDQQIFKLDANGIKFVQKCIEIVEANGLEEEGIYRVGGASNEIDILIAFGLIDMKTGESNVFGSPKYSYLVDPKTVSSAIKQYLRKLSDPLMTQKLYSHWINSAKLYEQSSDLSELQNNVAKLPPQNVKLLKILLKHLKKVVGKSSVNKMTAFNLAVVWGPSLLWSDDANAAALFDIRYCNIMVETMLNFYETFFPEPQTVIESSSENPKIPPSVPADKQNIQKHRVVKVILIFVASYLILILSFHQACRRP